MKLGIIVITCGNDAERNRNFKETIKCIKKQIYTNYELIVVEQSIDRKFYKQSNNYKYYGIYKDDLINRAWMRNVGAVNVTCEKLVFIDADMIFQNTYFNKIVEYNEKFMFGSTDFRWANRNSTESYFQTKDFNCFQTVGKRPTLKGGVGFGAIVIIDRTYFFDVLGGYIENFIQYGYEDREIARRAAREQLKTEFELPICDYTCIHLKHGNKDLNGVNENLQLFYDFNKLPVKKIKERLSNAEIGNTNEFRMIWSKE